MKEITKRLRREPTEWVKFFSSYSSNIGLICRLYKELKFLIPPNKRLNQKSNNWNKQTLLRSKIANKYTKKGSVSLVIREMQIKQHWDPLSLQEERLSLRSHVMTNEEHWRDCRGRERVCIAGGTRSGTAPVGVIRKLNLEIPSDPTAPLPRIFLKELKTTY